MASKPTTTRFVSTELKSLPVCSAQANRQVEQLLKKDVQIRLNTLLYTDWAALNGRRQW